THVLREDPTKKGLLYLGTERGIHFSPDAGTTWHLMQLNLPTVAVHDLVVKGTDLVIATHGRSLWILDDLSAVRAWKPEVPSTLAVVPPRPVIRWSYGSSGNVGGYADFGQPGPTPGVVVYFHLPKFPKTKEKEKEKETFKVRILDSKKELVAEAIGEMKSNEDDEDDDKTPDAKKRTFEIKEGANKFVWDMTYDGAEAIPGAQVDAGAPGMPIPAPAGVYQLQFVLGNQTQEVTATVERDPRVDAKLLVPDQLKLALRARDAITKLSRTVARLRSIQKQLKLRADLFKEVDTAKDVLKQSKELGEKLDTLEGKLHNPKAKIVYDIFAARGGAMLYSQWTWLLANVTDADGPPTRAQLELAEELDKTLAGLVAEFEAIITTDVVKLNAAGKPANVPDLYVPPLKK
ncbi:MAG: hypothetical protein ACRCZF_00865, partial [Gemmataceae bacterium]